LGTQDPNLIDLEQERRLRFCKAVFDALCDLEDLDWMGELSNFVDDLRSRHGAAAICDCRLFHASSGSTPRPDAKFSTFDLPGRDSFFAKMDSLGRIHLDDQTFRRLREERGVKENTP